MGGTTLLSISKECGQYDPDNKSKKWLKDHAGDNVEIISSDNDLGILKVFKVRSLTDSTTGTAWKRELIG